MDSRSRCLNNGIGGWFKEGSRSYSRLKKLEEPIIQDLLDLLEISLLPSSKTLVREG